MKILHPPCSPSARAQHAAEGSSPTLIKGPIRKWGDALLVACYARRTCAVWDATKPLMLPTRLACLDSNHRRRQTETQRAVAEAELDLCIATANTLDISDLAEASPEDVTRAECVVMGGKEIIGGPTIGRSVATGGFGEATGKGAPGESREDRRGKALEPGYGFNGLALDV